MLTFIKSLFTGKQEKTAQNDQQEYVKYMKSEMSKEVDNELERIFIEGVDDHHKRNDFYKLLLESDLYFIGNLEQNEGEEERKMQLSIFTIQGREMAPFFTSLKKLEKTAEGREGGIKYVQGKFKDICKLQTEFPFIMNPGHIMVKIFEPEEIKDILNGVVFDKFREDTPAGTELQIGLPADKPEELISTLNAYARQEDAIQQLHLALVTDEVNGGRIVIAIEFAENTEGKATYYDDIGEMIQKTSKPGEFIDLIEVKEESEISQYIQKYGLCIY